MAQNLFTFQSPVSQSDTTNMIKSAVLSFGGKIKSEQSGYLKCAWKRKGFLLNIGFEFFIGATDKSIVRAVTSVNTGSMNMGKLQLKKDSIDIIWERFLEALLSNNHDMEFGLSVGDPIVDAIMYSDGEVQQIYSSSSKHTPSYGKALVGGMLFGEVGAVLGGMGGKSHTNTQVSSQAAKRVYMKVRMSNGRIKEGYISTKSKEYNQIMVNMQRL